MKKSKYNSKKVFVDGIRFDSKDESKFYLVLQKQKKEGIIKKIELQPKYQLIPKFKDYTGKTQRAITYTADFKVIFEDDKEVVFDVKGFCTEQGKLRRKIFLYTYPEVELQWVASSIKYGDKYGWINYDELQKIRRANKREKAK